MTAFRSYNPFFFFYILFFLVYYVSKDLFFLKFVSLWAGNPSIFSYPRYINVILSDIFREGAWSEDSERCQVNKCRENIGEQQNTWRVPEPIMWDPWRSYNHACCCSGTFFGERYKCVFEKFLEFFCWNLTMKTDSIPFS